MEVDVGSPVSDRTSRRRRREEQTMGDGQDSGSGVGRTIIGREGPLRNRSVILTTTAKREVTRSRWALLRSRESSFLVSLRGTLFNHIEVTTENQP